MKSYSHGRELPAVEPDGITPGVVLTDRAPLTERASLDGLFVRRSSWATFERVRLAHDLRHLKLDGTRPNPHVTTVAPPGDTAEAKALRDAVGRLPHHGAL